MTSKTFNLRKEIISKDVLLRVSFTFLENYYIYLDASESEWLITLKKKDSSPITDLEKLEGEFRNALVNEEFRDSLLKSTKNVKQMIVSRALYGATNPQHF